MTGWNWFIAAAVLLILELLKPRGYLLWLSLSAALAAVVSWLIPELLWPYQTTVFIIAAALSCWWWRACLKRKPIEVNSLRAKQYFGRICTLEKPLKNKKGELEIDGVVWFITCNEDLAAQTKIKIVGANGVVLSVEKYICLEQP